MYTHFCRSQQFSISDSYGCVDPQCNILGYDAVLTWEPIVRRNGRFRISPQNWWTCKATETTICQPVNNPGLFTFWGLRGGAVGSATTLQAGRSRVRFPMVSLKFFRHNPSSRTMVLGLTQPLIQMSTRNISWGGGCKGGRCVGLTTLPPSCANCLETW